MLPPNLLAVLLNQSFIVFLHLLSYGQEPELVQFTLLSIIAIWSVELGAVKEVHPLKTLVGLLPALELVPSIASIHTRAEHPENIVLIAPMLPPVPKPKIRCKEVQPENILKAEVALETSKIGVSTSEVQFWNTLESVVVFDKFSESLAPVPS